MMETLRWLVRLIIKPGKSINEENLSGYSIKMLRISYYTIVPITFSIAISANIYNNPIIQKYGLFIILVMTFIVSPILLVLPIYIIKKLIVAFYYVLIKAFVDRNFGYRKLEVYYYPIILLTSIPIPALFLGMKKIVLIGLNIYSLVWTLWGFIIVFYYCLVSFFIMKNIFRLEITKSFMIGCLPTIILNLIFIFLK